MEGFAVFFVFVVTLSLFPGVNSLIRSTSPPSTWSSEFYFCVFFVFFSSACCVRLRYNDDGKLYKRCNNIVLCELFWIRWTCDYI